MPNPVDWKKITSWSFSAELLAQQRPEVLQAIGAVAVSWTGVERQLVGMVSGILGSASKRDDGGWDMNSHWVIATAIQQAETNRVRIKIAQSVLHPVLSGSPLLDEWKRLADRLVKRSRERNKVVHSEWSWSEQAPDVALRPLESGKLEAWDLGDFRDVASRITELREELWHFMVKVLNGLQDGTLRVYITSDMKPKAGEAEASPDEATLRRE